MASSSPYSWISPLSREGLIVSDSMSSSSQYGVSSAGGFQVTPAPPRYRDGRIVVGFTYEQYWYSCHTGVILYLLDFVKN